MSGLSESEREAVNRLHLTGWHLVAEHDPGCFGGDEGYCASHCPVPVQHPATDDEIETAIDQIAAARVKAALEAAAVDLGHIYQADSPGVTAAIRFLRDRAAADTT